MPVWFYYAVGAHQIFTKLAADKISDGLGGFVVEATEWRQTVAHGTSRGPR